MQSARASVVPKRGEIWLIIDNPSVPNDPHLPRPVVIVSTNPRNRRWDSVIVVPCSTGLQSANEKFHKPIPVGQGGLDRETHARCDLVSNLEKINLDFERGPLGELSEKYMWEIVRGIRACVGDNS
ncbi:MAG: type II toxin-antitoxin system PemK/MazF family toxin [Candidatus Obscuribacterales bacterium]|nr:type II toxin-antitoxin system PemK/MazF family toxin [Candidatus Obscuribacterales bacterium]